MQPLCAVWAGGLGAMLRQSLRLRCQRLRAPLARASAGTAGTGREPGRLRGAWVLAGEVGTGRGGQS